MFGNALKRAAASKKAWLGALAVIGLVLAGVVSAGPASAAPRMINVRDFGARGNGSANDTAAINRAIVAANRAADGGIVRFAPGTYRSANSIHMLSNVTLQLDAGATIMGAGGSGYDPPEVTLSGIRLRRGGHFAALINGCTNVKSDRLTIDTASDRDGWNIISTTNVTITNANIAANDDALVFKSDYALGAKLANGNVTVTNARLSARCCNALMFGSETCGDFTNYRFRNITITGAGKSGLGMVSMDGARISNVRYEDITMSGTQSPIMIKIGTRRRCGNSPGVGSVSDIHYTNITGTRAGSFSPTIWGESGHRVSNITFTNVNLTLPGGHGTMGTGVPSNESTDYNPRSIGTRPAYGWYLHNVSGIRFVNSSVRFSSNDGRPAVIANAGSTVGFDHFTAQRGSGSPFDLGFQSITGFCVAASENTAGGELRVSSTGSSRSCGG